MDILSHIFHFYIGKLFLKFKYKTEECIIEGMIFGLVFPLHASILIMCLETIKIEKNKRFVISKVIIYPSIIEEKIVIMK